MAHMQTTDIEIVPVTRKNSSLRWKWRHVDAEGRIKESKEEYALYYECVIAARESGYRPKVKCA
jgi:hypothetical protein